MLALRTAAHEYDGPMGSDRTVWLRTATICGALLVVPIVGFIVILVSPGSSSAESSDEPRGVQVATDDSSAPALRAGRAKAPAKVRKCCMALGQQARTAKIDWRPAYAEAAKACNQAVRGDDPPSALATVASSLGGRTVPLPKECK